MEHIFCSKCKKINDRFNQRYCTKCHAAYMREWRKNHQLTKEQQLKDNARSYAGVYKRRGKIQQEPCKQCGNEHSQMHHEDYSKPLEVIWLCRKCHLELHNANK